MSRPKYQRGQITHRGAYWVLRFHQERTGADGTLKRVRTTVPICPYFEMPYKGTQKELDEIRTKHQEKINRILGDVNQHSPIAVAEYTLAEFIEGSYFNRLEARMKIAPGNALHIEPSTVKNYKDIFHKHVESSPAAKIQLRSFTARDGSKFVEALPQELSHQTHLRILNFLRGVFTWAIQDQVYRGENPLRDVKAGGRTTELPMPDGAAMQGKTMKEISEMVRRYRVHVSQKHAYTLEESAEMLGKLSNPARTVVAVAAFTGLTRSELRGLKWSDYDGETIQVRRKVLDGYIGPPKTIARGAGVIVAPVLKKILAKYKKEFPAGADDWMFYGDRLMRPLDLDHLSRRVIPVELGKNGVQFHGWHAFRRGLGTRLYELGVRAKDTQAILRHANVATTMAFYIKPSQAGAKAGMAKMNKLAKALKL